MNQHYLPLFKEQSSKSLSKYRSQSIEQRVNRIGKEMLVPTRRKQSKNVFTITTNSGIQGRTDPKSEEELSRRVRMLEYELKRKLNEDGILRNLFRSKQTHELNHIDLYLEMRSLEDKYNQLTVQWEESRKAADGYQSLLREQEEEHLKNMEELNVCLSEKEQEWVRDKQGLKMEMEKYRLQSEESRFLIEEFVKKNGDLARKNRELADELQVEQSSKNLEMIKVRSELQAQIKELQQTLAKANASLQQIRLQHEEWNQTRKHLEEQMNELRDQNQKLELHLNEIQSVGQQKLQKEQMLRRQQHDKYTHYYQQLRQQHEQQIERLTAKHLIAIKQEKDQVGTSQQLIISLQDTLKKHERQIVEYSQEVERLAVSLKEVEEELQAKEKEVQREIDTNARLAREVKEANFQKQQNQQQINKLMFDSRDKDKAIEKMQIKLAQSQQQTSKLIIKCEELKTAADNSQAYRKLNDKVYNENYKTLGRLIELHNQVKLQLQGLTPQHQCTDLILIKDTNQESLTEVVSALAEVLGSLLRCNQNILKDREESRRDRNIEMRQIISVLQHCKNTITGEQVLSLMTQYISLLRQRKSIKEEQKKQRMQTYHQLVQALINANTQHYFSSDNRPQFIRDSLDSTYLIRQFESKKKEQRWMERQSSGKNIKKKQRVETEPSSQYDLPLKRKLVIEEQDKQNVNANANKEETEVVNKRQSNPTRYINEIRERISHKYPSKRKEPKEELRSEVQKKYFRI